MGLRRLLSRWWGAFLGYAEERIPQGANLRADAERMLGNLETVADATSLAMTLSDEKYNKLQRAIREHGELGREAEQFLREGKAAEAERCLERQLEIADKIAMMKEDYEASQRDAEERVLRFQTERREVQRRVESIPELRDTKRLNEAQKKVDAAAGTFSLEGAKQSFDEAAGSIRRESRQLANKAAITADPNARLDRSIEESQRRRRIAEAMAALKERVSREGSEDVIDADTISEDPISGARKALEAPRFRMLTDGANREKSGVTVRRHGA